MQAPSKSKAWKNDDLDLQQADLVKEPSQQLVGKESDSQTDGEYQAIPKKLKTRETKTGQLSARDESEEPLEFSKAGQDSALNVNGATAEDDANWLKSRTGQLLGLDEDQHEAAVPQPHVNRASSAESAGEVADTDQDRPDAAESPPTPVEEQPKAAVDETEAQIRNTKRLFLRNLPYKITEEALVDEFSPFGHLEEVCQILLWSTLLLHDEP